MALFSSDSPFEIQQLEGVGFKSSAREQPKARQPFFSSKTRAGKLCVGGGGRSLDVL